MTKTAIALKLVSTGMTPYAAAKQVGIAPVTVYTAQRRMEAARAAGKSFCPCCGKVMR